MPRPNWHGKVMSETVAQVVVSVSNFVPNPTRRSGVAVWRTEGMSL
jgi:hypothetical protein